MEPTLGLAMGAWCLAASVLVNEADEAWQRQERREKRTWVKKWRKNREPGGNVQRLLRELQPGTDDFRYFLRMDELCFNRILAAITDDIEKENTNCRLAITTKEKLSVTLRFLATGETFRSMDFSTKLSKSFIAECILEVCEAIYKNMNMEFLKVFILRVAFYIHTSYKFFIYIFL